jgi:hypothetical protein
MYCFKGTYGSFALRIRNSIIWGNAAAGILKTSNLTPAVTNSITQDSYTGTNNSSADPSFANPQPAAAAPATAGDYHLQSGSPAIDTGDNSLYPPNTYNDWQTWYKTATGSSSNHPVTQALFDTHIAPELSKDMDGTARIKNTTIDMGAYEY